MNHRLLLDINSGISWALDRDGFRTRYTGYTLRPEIDMFTELNLHEIS